MIYLVIAVAGLAVVVVIGRIAAGAGAKTKRNDDFLANATASEVMPSRPALVTAPLTAGAPHAVWLELALAATGDITFELALSVEVDGNVLVSGAYPVTFNDEQDARGLPNPPGISALNTRASSLGRGSRLETTLRAFRFDAPGGASAVKVGATLVPGSGVTIERARLLVTRGDAPAGSGTLPAGMRAIG